MLLLVCQGSCNPGLAAYDADRDAYALVLNRVHPDGGGASPPDARGLIHTSHAPLDNAFPCVHWSCQACGTHRLFGNES